MKEREIKWCVE